MHRTLLALSKFPVLRGFWRCNRRSRSQVQSPWALILVAVWAAEIWCLGILPGLDDAAADGAGAGEQLKQRGTVVPADHALQRGQILGEATEHLEHGLLVVEEHVAPHHGIGGGDA